MSQYDQLSNAELITKIQELDGLVKKYKEERDSQELLKFPWIGNLGSWEFNLKTNRVICNIHKVMALGYSEYEIPDPMGHEFFTEKLHPSEYESTMENMRQHLRGDSPAYEVTYQIRTKSGSWKWFYDRGTITQRDQDGHPEVVSGIVFDITEQKRMESLLISQNEHLFELAKVDYLTGVYNRKALNETMEYELKRADRNKKPLSVIMLDVDHFKQINDYHGHLIGDEVLVQVANVVKKSIRWTDFIGRYGGEEFVVILPECSREDGGKIAEKIRADIEGAEFSGGVKVTISAGVNEYKQSSLDHFVLGADKALYAAKNTGRNRVCLSE